MVSIQGGFITSEITHTVAIKTVKYERENFVWIEYDVTVISGEFPKHEMEGRCFGWRRTTRRTCSTDMLVICVTSQPNGPNHCLVYKQPATWLHPELVTASSQNNKKKTKVHFNIINVSTAPYASHVV